VNIIKNIKNLIPHSIKKILKKIRNKVTSLETLKLYKTKTGNYYMPFFSYQDIIKKDIINDKIWGKFVYDIAKEYIEENTIVLDAGANFGQLSVLFSKLKKNVEVYSFESSKFIFKILQKNIDLNNANVRAVNCILGNEGNKVYYIKKGDLSKFSSWGSNNVKIVNKKQPNLKTEEVQAVKIDDIEFNKKISFFKIDVQGYDLNVLKGAKSTILKHKMPIMFEYEKDFENEYKYSFNSFENFINGINYKIFKNFDNKNFLIKPR
jgi:FkbM family methyltransferase